MSAPNPDSEMTTRSAESATMPLMKKLARTVLLSTLVAACAPTVKPTKENTPGRPAALDAAHADYLDGDWLALTEDLRAVLLESQDEAVRANAFELLEKAYEAEDGKLPAKWTPPPGVDRLRYANIRATKDGTYYRTVLSGRALKGVAVDQIRVTRASGEVLLDRRLGIGTFSSEPEDGGTYFEIESDELVSLPAPGVFELSLELASGDKASGWFLADRLTSEATPEVLAPTGVVHGPHPEARWTDFHSAGYRPYELRNLSLYLVHRDGTGALVSPWSLWTNEILGLGTVKLGDHPSEPKKASLEPGEYCMALTFSEERSFGPIRLARRSRRVQPFVVAP